MSQARSWHYAVLLENEIFAMNLLVQFYLLICILSSGMCYQTAAISMWQDCIMLLALAFWNDRLFTASLSVFFLGRSL